MWSQIRYHLFYNLVFIWVRKHHAAQKYRYELQRQMTTLMTYEHLAEVLRSVAKREER